MDMYKITKLGLQAVAESPSFSLFYIYPDIGKGASQILITISMERKIYEKEDMASLYN